MDYIKDVNALSARIVEIKKVGKLLDSEIHLCAVSALYHAQEHGNLTSLSDLSAALPKSARRNAFVYWACQHAPVQFSGDTEVFTKTKGKNQKPFLLVQAQSTPFWEFTKERKPMTITIEGLLAYIANKVKTGIERGDIKVEELAGLDKELHNILIMPSATVSKAA